MNKEIKISIDETYEKVILELLNSPYKHFLLSGDLGVGKTTFTSEFIRKVNDNRLPFYSLEVMSPTFSIINEYQLKDLLILHVDLYRVDNDSFDIEDITERINEFQYLFVEWHEKIPELQNVLSEFLYVKIKKNEDGTRTVLLSASA